MLARNRSLTGKVVVAAFIGVSALAVTATGVTYAVTAVQGYKACATSHNRLVLADRHGQCAAKQTVVHLGQRGPAGAQGQRGPAGPVGATGATGTQGIRGVPGADGTGVGIARDFYSANNVALTISSTSDASSFTTAKAGHLFISKTIDELVPHCDSGPTTVFLVLDGTTRVPGTVIDSVADGTVLEGVALTGVTTDAVSAGAHTASIGLTCAGNQTGTFTRDGAAVAVIVLS